MNLLAFLLAACAPDDAAALPAPSAPPAPQELTLNAPYRARSGRDVTLRLSGARPGEPVTLYRGTGVGDGPCLPQLGGACVELTGIEAVQAVEVADARGDATFTVPIPRNAPNGAAWVWMAAAERGPGGVDSVVSDLARVRAHDGLARFRAVSVVPDAQMVDVYLDGALHTPGLHQRDVSAWSVLPLGPHVVEFRASGAAPTSPPISSYPFETRAGNELTVVLSGPFVPPQPQQVISVFDAHWGAPANLTWRTAIVQASPDAVVDFDFGADGVVEYEGLEPTAMTALIGDAVPTSARRLAVRDGVTLTLPEFASGDEITLISTGLVSARRNAPDGFGVLVLDRDGVVDFVRPDPVVYVLNASPGSTLDVSADGAPLAGWLPFRSLSAPTRLMPGDHVLDITDPATGAALSSQVVPALADGESYLLVATGQPGAPLQIIAAEDGATITPAAASLQVINASPDTPTVDVGRVWGRGLNVVWPSLAFGQVGEPIAVPTAAFDLGVAVPYGPPLATFAVPPLAPGRRVVGVTTGLVSDGSLGLTVVDMSAARWRAVTAPPR